MYTYCKNRFFLVEFSITNSLERPFFPSRTIQAFSLVSASSVSAVVTKISYSVRGKTHAVILSNIENKIKIQLFIKTFLLYLIVLKHNKNCNIVKYYYSCFLS